MRSEPEGVKHLDILTTYALLGLVLFAVRRIEPRAALFAAAAIVGVMAFLVGLAAGKHRMLAAVPTHENLLRRCEQVGYPIGLAGATVFAVGGGTANLTGLMVSIVTAPFLAAASAATLLRLFTRRPRVADALAPAGPSYLGQSLRCVLVFTGVGLGLAGQTAPAQTLLIVMTIFVA